MNQRSKDVYIARRAFIKFSGISHVIMKNQEPIHAYWGHIRSKPPHADATTVTYSAFSRKPFVVSLARM